MKIKIDRTYWVQKSSKESMRLFDELIERLDDIIRGYSLNYVKKYIGLSNSGGSENFIAFTPTKKHIRIEFKIKKFETTDKLLKKSGLELRGYNYDLGHYKVILKHVESNMESKLEIIKSLADKAKSEYCNDTKSNHLKEKELMLNQEGIKIKPEKLFEPYAKVALYMKDQLKIIEKQYFYEKDPFIRSVLEKQMTDFKAIINEIFRQTGDFVAPDASKKALEYCAEKKLGNIFLVGWNQQKGFEKIPYRSKAGLMYEHKIPVNELIKMLIKSETVDDVLKIFLKQEIVWILKEEDKLLKNERSNRPNPNGSYNKAGIEVIKNSNTAAEFYLKLKKIIPNDQ